MSRLAAAIGGGLGAVLGGFTGARLIGPVQSRDELTRKQQDAGLLGMIAGAVIGAAIGTTSDVEARARLCPPPRFP